MVKSKSEKLDILAIGVHPDDVELSCCGTLLKHIDMGLQVGILDLTEGELGTRGDGGLRLIEAQEAAQQAGIRLRMNARLQDGFFENNTESKMAIVPFIRHTKPDIVLANAIYDRHPDHGRAAQTIADACFLAGLRKVKTTYQGLIQEAWRPRIVLHYLQDFAEKPDIVVDISPYMEKKLSIIKCFASQFFDQNSDEPETPISGMLYLEQVKGKSMVYGRYIGVDFAEAYRSMRPMGVNDLRMLI